MENLTLNYKNTLIGTSDLKLASRIGHCIKLARIADGKTASYKIAEDGNIIITAGSEIYEIKGV